MAKFRGGEIVYVAEYLGITKGRVCLDPYSDRARGMVQYIVMEGPDRGEQAWAWEHNTTRDPMEALQLYGADLSRAEWESRQPPLYPDDFVGDPKRK